MQAQRLLREDIIDKVLKRDMTALFGVRRIMELEQTFIYLCMHDGGIQDIAALASNLGISRTTVNHFIHLLEMAHLLRRLPSFGSGKEVLKGRSKIYLADPAIASAILMKGKNVIEEPKALGQAVETAVCKHLFAHSGNHLTRFSYWKGVKDKEVDLIMHKPTGMIPFEVKYMSRPTEKKSLSGLLQFCKTQGVNKAFAITKEADDCGLIIEGDESLKIMRIPASIFCYWLGESELTQRNLLNE